MAQWKEDRRCRTSGLCLGTQENQERRSVRDALNNLTWVSDFHGALTGVGGISQAFPNGDQVEL
jgi:hypothetical protein